MPRTPQLKLWHVTALWQKNNMRLRKEMIVTGQTKELAIRTAESRIPMTIKHTPEYKTTAHDLGPAKDNTVWFSSDISLNALNRPETKIPSHEIYEEFMLLWGQEIGWRSTNQSADKKDLVILSKLKNTTMREKLLTQWSNEYLESASNDYADFFRKKLAEYLGTDVQNIEDMIPVSDNEYDRIIGKARQEAAAIIENAEAKMQSKMDEILQIANALNVPTQQAPQEQTSAQQDNTKNIQQDTSAANTTISDATQADHKPDIETHNDTVEHVDETNSQQNDSEQSEPIEKEPRQDKPTEEQERDFFADFPDIEEPKDDEDDGPSYEMPPDDKIPNDDYEDPTIDDVMAEIQNTSQAPQQIETQSTETPKPLISDENAIERLKELKPDILITVLSDLEINATTKTGKKQMLVNAKFLFEHHYQLPANTTDSQKASQIVHYISSCAKKNNMTAIQYVYNRLIINNDDDDIPFA